MSISSIRAAYKICNLSDWMVNNLEIQKILYLANMIYVGRHDKLLINEAFEAGKHGPILPRLYNKLKRFRLHPIKKYIFEKDVQTIDDEEINNILEEAWEKLGNQSLWQLTGMTHRKNGAFCKVYEQDKTNTITIEDIKEEYNSLLTV